MKKLSDKEIQDLLESKKQYLSDEDLDAYKTYQLLFDTLSQEPDEGLPIHFAEKVSRKAMRLGVQKQIRRYWLMVGSSILFTLCICAASLFVYQLPSAIAIFKWVSEARWIVLFSVSMFALIQFADYWLMDKKRLSQDS